MGYRLVGTNKKGEKTFKFAVELGKDIFGKRQRFYDTKNCTLSEAKLYYAEIYKKYYHKGNNANVRDLTFLQYSEIFIKKYCEGNIGLITINNYKRLLKYIMPYLGNIKINKISSYMLDSMYNKLKKGVNGKELSYNSMYDYYKLINVMFNQAVKWKFLDENPNNNTQKPKKEKVEQKFYDLEQVAELTSHLQNESIKYRTLVILALDSGARRGEISGLRWSDIDFDSNTMRIERSLKVVKGIVDEKKPKTKSSNRIIFLSDTTINLLKEYKSWQDDYILKMGSEWKGTDRVFTDKYGEHINPATCYKIFTKILKKYNLEHIRFHDLRHTSASILIHKGINPKAVSQRLGHSNINITSDIYAHTFEIDKKTSAYVLDEIIKNG